MNDESLTPFDLFDLSKPFGKGIIRKATVGEAKRAVGAMNPIDRTFGELFFAFFGKQDRDVVKVWLNDNNCWA